MKFSQSLAYCAFVAIANAAKLTNSASDYNGITTGKALAITWAEASGPVTISLKNGPSTNLRTVSVLTTAQSGNSYTWTPDKSLTTGTYALEITDASGFNYSMQFHIEGSMASSSSTTTTSQAPVASSSMMNPSGHSSAVSSYFSSSTSNFTATISNPAHATGTYVSAQPTSTANFTSTMVAPSSTSSYPTVPADTNTASSATSPLALVMLMIIASIFIQ